MQYQKFFLFVIILSFSNILFCKREIKRSQVDKEIIYILKQENSSIVLPNWIDTIAGIGVGALIYGLQKKYVPNAESSLQETFFQNSLFHAYVCRFFSLMPAVISGGWVFFELRQFTSSGLYDRAITVLKRLDFKAVERDFTSVYEFQQYIAHHGNAKELKIINDEYNYVVTHKFLSRILLELTYALRLLERCIRWSFDSSFQARVEIVMYEVRTKIRNVTHNKIMFESDQHYQRQLISYQEHNHLLNEERLTNVVEGDHVFSKVKFVIKTLGKIIGFFFGSRRNNH